jgi:amino acid permease
MTYVRSIISIAFYFFVCISSSPVNSLLGTLISFFLLLWASDHAQCYSYGELAERVLGPVGGFVLRVVFLIDLISTLSAYLVLIGDSLYKFSASRLVWLDWLSI